MTCLDYHFVQSDLVGSGFLKDKLCEISVQICNLKNWAMSHLNGFHAFPCDGMRKTFTFMNNSVFEHSNTFSFALLACIILYINGTQFRCSVFTFVQYICNKISANIETN